MMRSIIVTTDDGSHTLYVPDLDEHYHSVHGAISESDHIFIKSGLKYSTADPVNIFEVGFGTGLNALLTCNEASAGKRKVLYTSVEKYPLEEETVRSLNYAVLTGNEGKRWFELIHSCDWGRPVEITENFILHKIHGDIVSEATGGLYDLIYSDAFRPEKQPESEERQKEVRQKDEDVGGCRGLPGRRGDLFVRRRDRVPCVLPRTVDLSALDPLIRRHKRSSHHRQWVPHAAHPSSSPPSARHTTAEGCV